MIVKSLKTYFNNALLGYYPDTEINSFFNILSEHVLRLKRHEIPQNLYQVVSGKKYDKFQEAIDKLKLYQPIQYIMGETEFYGLRIKVDQSVLIPRPETEELVDWILKHETENDDQIHVLDIGTGSGCIAIALAKRLSHAKVYAMDVCSDALKTAKKNAQLNEVDVELVESDILNGDIILMNNDEQAVKLDFIVSNPPYVREMEKDQMSANVLDHEPHLALFVEDEDPLLFYKHITQFASRHLKPNGKVFFEINESLGDDMMALLHNLNFDAVEIKQDINNKDRMIKAIKS